MLQDILTYGLVLGAVAYLAYKWFWPKKPKKNQCNTNCGCS